MPDSRFHHLLLFAILALALIVAACRGSDEPTPTPTSPPPTAVDQAASAGTPGSQPGSLQLPTPTPAPTPPTSGSIVLWHSWAQADGDALEQILANFRARYPGITVDTLFVAYPDLAQAYTDAALAGSGPDLVLGSNWWLGDLVAAGAVQPLDGRLAVDELAQYWPAAVDALRWQGALYGLPTHVELVSLYVNQALAPAGGAPATTDALLAQAQQNPQLGAGLYASFYHLFWGLPAYGAELFDPEGRAILDRTDGAAGFLAWLQAMAATPGTFVAEDYGMLLDRFKKGEFAYFVDGPWSIDELRSALGDNLAVAPLPAGPAGPAGPWLSADGVFVNPKATAEQQELALLLARHLTSPASGSILAQSARRLPAQRSADPGTDPLLRGFAQQSASAQPIPAIPELTEALGYGGDMLLKALAGVDDPETIVRETSALINEANGK